MPELTDEEMELEISDPEILDELGEMQKRLHQFLCARSSAEYNEARRHIVAAQRQLRIAGGVVLRAHQDAKRKIKPNRY